MEFSKFVCPTQESLNNEPLADVERELEVEGVIDQLTKVDMFYIV
jgi:hypothetical protein